MPDRPKVSADRRCRLFAFLALGQWPLLDSHGKAFIMSRAMQNYVSVREWANQQGLTIGSRGRLPRRVVQEYADARFELLAICLEPRFGNIYDDRDVATAGYDQWTWSDELKASARHYLLNELPADVWMYMFGMPDDAASDADARQRQVDDLLTGNDPFDVASLVRDAAISALPTLGQLFAVLQLNGRKTWPGEYERADVMSWLDPHADEQRLSAMEPSCGDTDALTDQLSPADLIAAWERVAGVDR